MELDSFIRTITRSIISNTIVCKPDYQKQLLQLKEFLGGEQLDANQIREITIAEFFAGHIPLWQFLSDRGQKEKLDICYLELVAELKKLGYFKTEEETEGFNLLFVTRYDEYNQAMRSEEFYTQAMAKVLAKKIGAENAVTITLFTGNLTDMVTVMGDVLKQSTKFLKS